MSNKIDEDIEKNKILVLIYDYYSSKKTIESMLQTAIDKMSKNEDYALDIKLCRKSYKLLQEAVTRAKRYNKVYSDTRIKNIESTMSLCLDGEKKILEDVTYVFEHKN